MVDASVAFKWLVDETGTEAALEIACANDLIARHRGIPLVSADQRLIDKVRATDVAVALEAL